MGASCCRDFNKEFDSDLTEFVVTPKERDNFCRGPKELGIKRYRALMAWFWTAFTLWVLIERFSKDGWYAMRVFIMLPYWQIIEVCVYFWLALYISDDDDEDEPDQHPVDALGPPRYIGDVNPGGDEGGEIVYAEPAGNDDPFLPIEYRELPECETQCWIHMNIAYTVSFMVMILFWTLIYEGWIPKAEDFFLHGTPFTFVAIDVFFSGVPFRYLHVWLPMYYLFIYFSIAIVYNYCSGDIIYSVMDYRHRPVLLLLPVFIICVLVPVFQTILWAYKRMGLQSTGLGAQ